MNTFVSICESGAGRKTGHVLEREREREREELKNAHLGV